MFLARVLLVSFLLLVWAAAPASRAWAQEGPEAVDSNASRLYAMQQLGKTWPALQRPVTIDLDRVSLVRALRVIAQEADFGLAYSTDLIPEDKLVSVQIERGSMADALRAVLENTDLEVVITSKNEIVLVKQGASRSALSAVPVMSVKRAMPVEELAVFTPGPWEGGQQTGTIAGMVTDSTTGESLPGVNVVIAGTTQGAATDASGVYTISGVEPGTYDLIASFVGYTTKRVEGVEVLDEKTTQVDIALQRAEIGMDEVIVVGYGTQQRSDVTGSISSVQGEDLTAIPYVSVEQAMQGKLAGVNITPYSGEPGAPLEVQIRGVGTFSNAEPLYIVDGVPMQGEDMTMINLNNIASIEVLKDAASAAIYGARAANGVVLITTKKGQPGALQVNYSGYAGLQSFTDFIPMLNSVQYAKLVNETTEADGLPYEPAFYPADPSKNENLQHYVNWQKAAFRTAPIMNHNVRISGGTENAIYSVSAGYFTQKGIMVFNHFQRYSARINTRFDLSDKLTIGENVSFSRSENFNGGHGNDLHFAYLLGASPTMRLYKPKNEGGYGGPNGPETGVNNRANIVGRRDMRENKLNQNQLFGNVYAEYEFLPNLQYRLNFGFTAGWDQYQNFIRTYDMDNRQVRNASLSQEKSESYELLLENTLNYTADLTEDFHLELLAGFTQQSFTYEYISGSISQFASNDLRVLNAGKGAPSLSGGKAEWALRSIVGRANVRLYDKYLFSGTLRRDGSSRFGAENRWGNFPSFGLGWIVSEEEFMPDLGFIDFLKVRASWGQLGNQAIGNYVNQTTVTTDIRYVLGGEIVNGAAVTSLGNPQLKWEETTQTDVGIDVEMLDNRLLFSADYFVKNTAGILLRVPISVTTGLDRGSGPFRNAASMRNSGFEFEVTWRQTTDDLFYSISGNLSTLNNEVTSLGGESAIINYVANVYPNYGAFTITTPGKALSSFYGWVTDGVFQNQQEIDNHAIQSGAEPGDIKFKDLNGDGVITDADRTIIGTPWADLTYGINLNAQYKNFDLGISIQGVQGRELYNSLRAFLESMNGEHGQMKTTLARWQPNDPSETMPRATRSDPNRNTRPSTRFVDDASYVRLNRLEIGYTLPSTLIGRIGFENLRVSVSGQNLLTLTGYPMYNPDTRGGGGYNAIQGNPLTIGVDAGAYPVPRTFQLGIQATF